MKITYDKTVDAAYIFLKDLKNGEVTMSYTCDPAVVGEINLDFDKKGQLVGIEVLDASKKLPRSLLSSAEIIGS
jgi:uncharacterized protein YuzE